MKEVVLDTETTGISVKEGHRIVEIGCIELDNLNLYNTLWYIKKKNSDFIIKNDYKIKTVKKSIKKILKELH